MQCVKDFEEAKEFHQLYSDRSLVLKVWANGDAVGIQMTLKGMDRIGCPGARVLKEAVDSQLENLTTIIEAITFKAVADLVDSRQEVATKELRDKCEEISAVK